MKSKRFHQISFTKYIIPFVSQLIALYQNEACSRPHHSNHLAKLKECTGTTTLRRGKSKADLPAESAFSLPLKPIWLGTHQKVMS